MTATQVPTCAEEEIAAQLAVYCVMLRHFGWDKAHAYIALARTETLKMASAVPRPDESGAHG